MSAELSQTAVFAALDTRWLGRSYQYFPVIGSTNDYLKQHPELPAGTVVVTDFQEAGRGRFDRVWQAPAGSCLLLSLLLRPQWPGERLAWVGMAAGLAGLAAIREVADVTVGLKWPNDLMVWYAGEWRKMSGLLLEMNWLPKRPFPDVVVGMGLNVNVSAHDLPATAASLSLATGRPISRLTLLCRFLAHFEAGLAAADLGQSPQPAWQEALITLGQEVEITAVRGQGHIIGTAEQTNEWGQLLVRSKDGIVHTVSAGDVTLRKR